MSLFRDCSTGKALDKDLYEEQKKEEKKKLKQMEDAGYDPNSPYTPRKREIIDIHLTDKEMAHLEDIYSRSIVHDFDDLYHLTDEERHQENELYDLFRSIQNVKTKYKRIDEYVINYRKVLKVVKEIAKTNGVYDPEEFEKKVLKGEIMLYGIQFPKYNVPKRKRKQVNWEQVAEYIANEKLDPKELLVEKRTGSNEYDVIENPNIAMKTYFGTSYEEFMKRGDFRNEAVDITDTESIRGKNIATPITLREIANDTKFNKDLGSFIRNSILDMDKSMRMRNYWNDEDSRDVFSDIDDDVRRIREMDEEREYFGKKKSSIPEFTGSFLSDKDSDKYAYEVDEYLRTHSKVRNFNGQIMTVQESEEEALRENLEEEGWNIRKFYGMDENEKAAKREAARENKRLKKIKERMIEQNRRKKQKVETVGFRVKKVDDDENGVNTKKKKRSKKYKKADKKARQAELFNDAYDDFETYAQSMLDD